MPVDRPTIYHIPICPFSQRVEIILALKGLSAEVEFVEIDITVPRPDWLLKLTGGTTALPVMELPDGRSLRESLVILRYVEEAWPKPPVARVDPFERAIERLMITREDPFTMTGYTMVMNRDRGKTPAFLDKMLGHYRWLNDFLEERSLGGLWLFEDFGLAEAVFTPIMMRFWFLEYYEGFTLPDTPEFARVRAWHDACIGHAATQQVSYERVVKCYYDYAVGLGNGALADGRARSTFVFEPDWRRRPMPPTDKYDRIASDEELGLV